MDLICAAFLVASHPMRAIFVFLVAQLNILISAELSLLSFATFRTTRHCWCDDCFEDFVFQLRMHLLITHYARQILPLHPHDSYLILITIVSCRQLSNLCFYRDFIFRSIFKIIYLYFITLYLCIYFYYYYYYL